MKTPLRATLLFLGLLAAGLVLNQSAFADDNMSCPGILPATHAALAEGDQSSTSHLQVSRKIEHGTEFDIDVCAADVALTVSNDGMLRISVDIARPMSEHSAVDYLRKLDISSHEAKLQLQLPHHLRAKVTIEVPIDTPDLTANLGRGDLSLAADRIGGERKINVGYGHVDFRGNEDAYSSLNVNIGLGNLHDNRKDGHNHHFIVARSFEGTGKGALEVNVGMGSVDLNPGQAKPI